jgi:sugar phosphate isomerase/epimerase
MNYGICSYSLHRTFAQGNMDIFDYISWCKQSGFTQLEPWMEHLKAGFEDDGYVAQVKAAADQVELPFGCVAVDGAHIYEPTLEARMSNRRVAYRWLDVAEQLGASQVRIDAGGSGPTLDPVLDILVDGYNDLIERAAAKGLEILIENHWGPTRDPDNLHLLLDKLDGLGLLLDTGNWPDETHERAWSEYARYARNTHFKARAFDDEGNEPDWDISKAVRILRQADYNGCWGIESVPRDGDELGAGLKTLALLKRELEG